MIPLMIVPSPFLAAFHAAPTDFALFRILADWLDERGIDRGASLALRAAAARRWRPVHAPDSMYQGVTMGLMDSTPPGSWDWRGFLKPGTRHMRRSDWPITPPERACWLPRTLFQKVSGLAIWAREPDKIYGASWCEFVSEAAAMTGLLLALAQLPFPQLEVWGRVPQ